MKPIILVTAFALFMGSSTVWAQQHAAKKHGQLSFNINLSDYTVLKTIHDSSFARALKQKDWLKPANKSFGIGLSYWKSLTKHIDFSGTLSGTLSNFPALFVQGDSIGQAGFSTQLDALLHFRLLKDKANINPFLTGGIGAGYFSTKATAYAPIGAGLQVRFSEGGFMVLQAQWRKALTSGITNDYMMYSIGFIQKAKTNKAVKKVTVQKEIPIAPVVVVVKDTDGDGVPDDKDDCPTEKGTVNGCPDSDNDGVADKDDKCPTIPGTKENHGCPEIKKEVQQKVDMAAKNIFFAFASDVIEPASFTALNEVVAVLKENTGLKLKIEAHADNKGTFGKNLMWSEKRAKAVADYFIAKGIAEDRIIFKGYGDTQPVADNATEEGRAKNRRVEMKVHY